MGLGILTVPQILVLYFILFLLGVYIFVYSDPNDKKSAGGKLSYYFTVTFPSKLQKKAKEYLPVLIYEKLEEVYDKVVNKPNPLLQSVYFGLYFGCFALYLLHTVPRLEYIDQRGSYGLFTLSVITYLIACTVKAGVITQSKDVQEKFNTYTNDGIIYPLEGRGICSTCQVPRVPRSKHCRICGICVPRFDHHCGWLNQCVGEQNYRVFLLFLLCQSGALLFGAYTTSKLLYKEIIQKRLFQAQFYNRKTGKVIKASLTTILQYIIAHEGVNIGLFTISLVMGLVLLGFLIYHLRLIALGMTTNETFKWEAAKTCLKRYVEDRKIELKEKEKQERKAKFDRDMEAFIQKKKITGGETKANDNEKNKGDTGDSVSRVSEPGKVIEERVQSPESNNPKDEETKEVKGAQDSFPNNQRGRKEKEKRGETTPMNMSFFENMTDKEILKYQFPNPYNLGWKRNYFEVLFPRSLQSKTSG